MTSPSTAHSRAGLANALLRQASVPEILIALGIPVGLFLSASMTWIVGAGPVEITDARVFSTLAIEVVLAACLLPYLRRRGWRPGEVAGGPVPLDVLRGAGLWIGCMAAYYAAFLVLSVLAPADAEALATSRITGTVSDPMVVAVCLINPVFEEFLWLGYTVPAVGSRFGLRAACITSVALRVAVHLYQGLGAFVGILPAAALLTLYFARTGRLWPVIAAHVILDAVGLATLANSR